MDKTQGTDVITNKEKHGKEITKIPDLKEEDLLNLKSWLATQDHLPHISDDQLILFLHSCYYDIARTEDCIEIYYTLRTNTPEFFANRDLQLPENKKVLQVLNFIEMPIEDPNGNYIIYHSLKNSDPSAYMFADSVKVFLMMIEACLQHGPSPGIVMLLDAAGVKFGHITRLSITHIRKLLTYVQEGMPIRLKAIHILNVIPVIDHIMFLIKPFMKKELYSLIHFHKGNNESIYKYLPVECLPEDYGGCLPPVAELDANYTAKLQKLCEYFKEDEKLHVDESKRSKDKKKKNHLEPDAAFKSLSID